MENKELIRKFSTRLWDQNDLSAIDDFFAEEILIHSPFKIVQGREAMKEIVGRWKNAFPDLLVKWEDFIAEGDKVVSRWQASGTHLGGEFSMSPTQRDVQYSGVTTYQLKDNKIIKYWALVDIHSILTQLLDYDSIADALD